MVKQVSALMAALFSFAVLQLPAGATVPKPVPITTCGQVVTTDAVLKVDLTCSGTALSVQASDVTVKLGGHRISSLDGLGTGIQVGTPGSANEQGVVIEGGQITGFSTGINIVGAGGMDPVKNQVNRTTLTGDTTGVFLSGGSYGQLVHVTIAGTNGVTSPTFNPASVDITSSSITASGQNVYQSEANITGGRLTGGSIESPTGIGIHIQHSHLNAITGVCGDTNFAVVDSTVSGGTILGGGGCYMDLSGNRFAGPGSGTAVDLNTPFSVPSVVSDNTFTGWAVAVVVRGPSSFSITDNTFRHNINGVVGCTGLGCEGGPRDRQPVRGQLGTGLSMGAGTWTIGSNTFLRNGGLGIDAVESQPGYLHITDAGGNVARGNLAPQCVGVVCTTH